MFCHKQKIDNKSRFFINFKEKITQDNPLTIVLLVFCKLLDKSTSGNLNFFTSLFITDQ